MQQMYSIVTTPDPILVKKADKVKKFDDKLHRILEGMEETLKATKDPVGVGLAAPQVGIQLRVFQMRPEENGPITNIINPEVVEISEGKDIPVHANSQKVEKMKKLAEKGGPKPKKGRLLEGCLSIPNIWGHVLRPKELTLKWQDENGKTHQKHFKGFPAIIIQHELDHLNGILFTKHVMEQNEKLYKSHKDEEGQDVFDEVKL